MHTGLPRVTFGIIVLNGEPFTRYNLRALYPFAHEIIVVEGACPGAARIATPEGHSTDGTLDVLERFKAEEDPEDKVQIVTRDGFWTEKDEMSQAYAARATGDYLWQVDVDEFYRPEDMQTVMDMLRDRRETTAVSFEQIQFWGGFDYWVDGWYLRRGAGEFHRLFRWGPGYKYKTHRPPTVLTPKGINTRDDTRASNWLRGRALARQKIFLYHYSLVVPRQVLEKCDYYASAEWAGRGRAREWAQRTYLELRSPYRAHNVYEHPGWLERYAGTHPPQIEALRADIESGKIDVELRRTDDIESLLRSPWYWLGKVGLKILEPVDRILGKWVRRFVRLFADPLGGMSAVIRKMGSLLGLGS